MEDEETVEEKEKALDANASSLWSAKLVTEPEDC